MTETILNWVNVCVKKDEEICISRQFLPDQPSQENIQYVLNQIFYRPSDAKWVLQIPLDN